MAVETIMENIRAGLIPSKTEYGFLVVDMAPNSPRFDPHAANQPHPATFASAIQSDEDADDPISIDIEEPELANSSPLNWQKERQIAARKRRAPRHTLLPAA